MDEIRHILVERDILAGNRGAGGWLVELLYAFQDDEHIYLAMVRPARRSPGSRLGIRPRGRLPFLDQRRRYPPQRTRQVLFRGDVPRRQRIA
jgi:hypothetical protein